MVSQLESHYATTTTCHGLNWWRVGIDIQGTPKFRDGLRPLDHPFTCVASYLDLFRPFGGHELDFPVGSWSDDLDYECICSVADHVDRNVVVAQSVNFGIS